MLTPVLLSTVALLATGVTAVPTTATKRGPVHVPLFRRRAAPSSFEKRAGKTFGVQVNDMGVGTYATIQIGTPPQNLTVQLDTGSNKLVVPGTACSAEQCDVERGVYHPDKSSTFDNHGAEMTQTYGDNTSYNGTWVTDIVSFGGYNVNYTFGMIETASTTVEDKSHGIMGLGWDTDADVSYSLPYDMSQGLWDDKQFGFYLPRVPYWESDDKMWDISQLTLNGVDKTKFNGDLSYAKLNVKNKWTIQLDAVQVGDKVVVPTMAAAEALVDTGTSSIWGPKEAVDAIYAELPGAYSRGNSWYAPCDSNLTITFTIAGRPIHVPWIDISGSMGNGTCYTFLKANRPDEDGMVETQWIIGAVAMHSNYWAFRYDPPSIGVAPLKAEFNTPAKYHLGSGPAKSNAATVAPMPTSEAPPAVPNQATTTVSKVQHPLVTDPVNAKPNQNGALPAMGTSASVVVGTVLALALFI